MCSIVSQSLNYGAEINNLQRIIQPVSCRLTFMKILRISVIFPLCFKYICRYVLILCAQNTMFLNN